MDIETLKKEFKKSLSDLYFAELSKPPIQREQDYEMFLKTKKQLCKEYTIKLIELKGEENEQYKRK